MITLRRRKEQKTDYHNRLALLRSHKPRLVVRRNLDNVHAQLVQYEKAGDRTVEEEITKNLIKYGWKGHKANIAAGYLIGLVIGFKAVKKGMKEAVLDAGLQTSTKGSVIYAVVAGARDAGLNVPADAEVLPPEERLQGLHVASLAKSLKAKQDKYKRQFGRYVKNGLDPEKLPEHFLEVKSRIMKEFEAVKFIQDEEKYVNKK